jgi:hypothetical protein
MYSRLLSLLVSTVAVACGSAAPTARVFDSALLDPRYPDMAQWAQAGVMPSALPKTIPPSVTLHPGDDLAAAVTKPNRTLRLAPGLYPVTKTLQVADGVVIIGAGAGLTKLVVQLRGQIPAAPDGSGFLPWTTGVLFTAVKNAGLENLTVTMDESLPPPPDPRDGSKSYIDDPDGKTGLHVVLVRFRDAQNCWVTGCELRNAGSHPLCLQGSRHLTLASTTVSGTYNKAGDSGSITITGSESCLLDNLDIANLNHVVIHQGTANHPCRFNVLVNSRLTVDVRFRNADSGHNLIQNCVISIPSWHDFPPISQGRAEKGERPPGEGNLIYNCTITRDFPAVGRSFSIADNPNEVYRVQDRLTQSTTVEPAGPAPQNDTLWPVR